MEVPNKEKLIQTEIDALSYILKMSPEDRDEEIRRLPWTYLHPWITLIRKASIEIPLISHGDTLEILKRHPDVRSLKRELEGDTLERFESPQDPQVGKKAVETLIKWDQEIGRHFRAQEAVKRLNQALKSEDNTELKQAMEEVSIHLRRHPEEEDDLAEVWKNHRINLADHNNPCEPHEGIRLDEDRRGHLAEWLNSKSGPRAALQPGRTLLIGGAAGAGKTSLGALIAVDALEAGCPVICFQLELSREEHLEHLIMQYIPHGRARHGDPRWWNQPDYRRFSNFQFPEEWSELLKIPKIDIMGTTVEFMLEEADQVAAWTETRRRKGDLKHLCNGLVLIDYVQLLTLKDQNPYKAQHEVLATACSRLAKFAADHGMVMVLLSQFTKETQKHGTGGELTGFHGADIARMAHCALTLVKAKEEKGRMKATNDMDEVLDHSKYGDARLIRAVKTRGEWSPSDFRGPLTAWFSNRALHGFEKYEPGEDEDGGYDR